MLSSGAFFPCAASAPPSREFLPVVLFDGPLLNDRFDELAGDSGTGSDAPEWSDPLMMVTGDEAPEPDPGNRLAILSFARFLKVRSVWSLSEGRRGRDSGACAVAGACEASWASGVVNSGMMTEVGATFGARLGCETAGQLRAWAAGPNRVRGADGRVWALGCSGEGRYF